MLADIHRKYANGIHAAQLLADCTAHAVSWRWATESMGESAPFMREQYGGPAPKWLADDKADPERHVHHGFDAAGRLMLQRQSRGRVTAWLHEADRRTGLQLEVHEGAPWLVSVHQYRYRPADGLLDSQHISRGREGVDTNYVWENGQLQRAVMSNWAESRKTWLCQHVYRYDEAARLDTITLEYLEDDGTPSGQTRLSYRRPRKGETLATVAARVESLLTEAITRALAQIPLDEAIYCLLICYTQEDFGAAWPPFLVWGREPYRRSVLEAGEDVGYYLWAPDEIREVQGDAHELWFDDAALKEACLLHNQLMDLRQSTVSAMRVLKNLAAHFNAPAAHAMLNTSDDFVVAHADNTGEIDPLKAMKAAVAPGRWTLLKARGLV
ncbi:hypothetical protein M2282_000819 [Variovorax boronicumulans]|uniref:hypothetical protein n=1 Tax=Variovorax boronicumulans TaxID=436515 RepID=UPI002473AFB6|nr:hypothetical protein [Variovorax boronicumulans]MDH6165691.1 hypothetical protein [Variovorax boronicumulans]